MLPQIPIYLTERNFTIHFSLHTFKSLTNSSSRQGRSLASARGVCNNSLAALIGYADALLSKTYLNELKYFIFSGNVFSTVFPGFSFGLELQAEIRKSLAHCSSIGCGVRYICIVVSIGVPSLFCRSNHGFVYKSVIRLNQTHCSNREHFWLKVRWSFVYAFLKNFHEKKNRFKKCFFFVSRGSLRSKS